MQRRETIIDSLDLRDLIGGSNSGTITTQKRNDRRMSVRDRVKNYEGQMRESPVLVGNMSDGSGSSRNGGGRRLSAPPTEYEISNGRHSSNSNHSNHHSSPSPSSQHAHPQSNRSSPSFNQVGPYTQTVNRHPQSPPISVPQPSHPGFSQQGRNSSQIPVDVRGNERGHEQQNRFTSNYISNPTTEGGSWREPIGYASSKGYSLGSPIMGRMREDDQEFRSTEVSSFPKPEYRARRLRFFFAERDPEKRLLSS
jgi:hypothetical protein